MKEEELPGRHSSLCKGPEAGEEEHLEMCRELPGAEAWSVGGMGWEVLRENLCRRRYFSCPEAHCLCLTTVFSSVKWISWPF